jgi:hypothetical protein
VAPEPIFSESDFETEGTATRHYHKISKSATRMSSPVRSSNCDSSEIEDESTTESPAGFCSHTTMRDWPILDYNEENDIGYNEHNYLPEDDYHQNGLLENDEGYIDGESRAPNSPLLTISGVLSPIGQFMENLFKGRRKDIDRGYFRGEPCQRIHSLMNAIDLCDNEMCMKPDVQLNLRSEAHVQRVTNIQARKLRITAQRARRGRA